MDLRDASASKNQECFPPCNWSIHFSIFTHFSQFFSETIILIQLLFSHYSFNFSGIHVSISPAGSAVIGPQIAQYIPLRPATKMKSSLLTSRFTLHQSEIDFLTNYKFTKLIANNFCSPKLIIQYIFKKRISYKNN